MIEPIPQTEEVLAPWRETLQEIYDKTHCDMTDPGGMISWK